MDHFRALSLKLLAAAILPLAVGGCASMSAAPPRVLSADKSMDLISKDYAFDTVLKNFDDSGADSVKRSGLNKKQYRNLVIGLYMNAIDANYYEFRYGFSQDQRELGLGFDLALVGLGAVSGVVKQSKLDEIAASMSGIAGTRAVIDKNLYFDKTVPAIFAAIDTERTELKAAILRNMQKEAGDYPLLLAFAELDAYERAGILDRGIENLTKTASEERAAAELRYSNAPVACDSEDDLTAKKQRITTFAAAQVTQKATATLQALAKAMGVNDNGSDTDLYVAIYTGLNSGDYCSEEKLDALIADATVQPWGATL